MNRTDFEKLFSQKVAKYINEGYAFYLKNMNVSYGNHDAVIDLYKNNTLVRVSIASSREHFYTDKVIHLNIYTMDGFKSRCHISESDMTMIEKLVFYKISDNCYLTSQEYINQKDIIEAKKKERYYNHDKYNRGEWIKFDDKASKIVLPYIQRKPKCKTVKASDLKVYKVISSIGHSGMDKEICYRIEIKSKGKCYILKQTFTKPHNKEIVNS